MPRMFPLLEYCSQLLRYDRGILLSWLPPDLPSATNQLPADLLGALVPQALVLLAKALLVQLDLRLLLGRGVIGLGNLGAISFVLILRLLHKH